MIDLNKYNIFGYYENRYGGMVNYRLEHDVIENLFIFRDSEFYGHSGHHRTIEGAIEAFLNTNPGNTVRIVLK